MNPFPSNLGDVLRAYPRIIVPEGNLDQLSRLVRAEFLVDAVSLSKVQGVPFLASEIERVVLEALGEDVADLAPMSGEGDPLVDESAG
jgi:2-oxoglutarate ferredoxin oxidoreductase subunit alpha